MIRLWSFQPLSRLAELRESGELVGSWEHVPRSRGDAFRKAYAAMVAAMERAGVLTNGRPPVWAWGGRCGVTVLDAHMLVGEPLWDGYATVEFTAPGELALATDYGAWNDYLFALLDGVEPVPPGWDVPTPVADELVQVCLPGLRAEWVREVRPLPRSPHDVTDWSASA
ncbi:hypothetical protein [Pseudonocardia adelaidensis]|uniref:Uncharacterized protein n=1 Tax=Pseudonocardia adelaidensis TaxID=648754 RepID=A0ABP9NKW1_9PSEU